jgi:hypothetical protein
MNALNPANVPLASDKRWRIAATHACTRSQADYLHDLLALEEVSPRQLFGDGYTDLGSLSSWAVHWAIEVLTAQAQARAQQEADRAVEEAQEQDLKTWIAAYYRARNPQLGVPRG